MSVQAATYSGLPDHRRRIPDLTRNTTAVLQHICDAGIAVCVLVIPLTMAGIREYGVALFVLCSFVGAITWAAQQLLSPRSCSPVAVPAIVAGFSIGLVWLQLQPLPGHLLDSLSPFNLRFLPLWGSPEGRILKHSGWQQISMTPEATRSGLVLLIAYAMFFLTVVQRLRTQPDIDRLIKLVAISATVMGTIGIAQILIGDDKFLWLIDHPTRTASWPAKGTFTNQNHFAHFLALGIGPLLWWWQSFEQNNETKRPRIASRPDRQQRSSHRFKAKHPLTAGGVRFPHTDVPWPRLLIGGCAAVVTFAAVCSLSRGGIGGFLVAAAIALFAAGRSWKSLLSLVIPLAAFLVASLVAFGTEELTGRWNQIVQSKSIDDLSHGRWVLWTALSQAVSEFWPAGSGVGSHADIYPIWLSEQFNLRFSHAENGYLQILLETGVPGFVLLLSGMGMCGWWCVRGWRHGTKQQRRCLMALSAGLVASVLHSLVDFVWYIPGCMILTLVIIACVSRCSQLTTPARSANHPPVTRFATLLAGILLAAVLPIGQLFADTIQRDLNSSPHWQSFYNEMRKITECPGPEQIDSLNDHLDFLIGKLERCTTEDSFHHDASTALAPLYLQRFEQRSRASGNQMSLADVRDTVRQAKFETSQEMHEWLVRAFGDDINDLYRAIRTARCALRKRPLRSESYIVLSETAFLAGSSQAELKALIEQAVRVRPHEPGVLYAAGLLANDSDDAESAWKLWRHAADLDPAVALQIITQFVERMPAGRLVEQLSPNKTAFRILYDVFGEKGSPEDQKIVAMAFANDHLEALRQDGAGTAGEWKLYATLLIVAEHHQDAIRCLRRSVRLQPNGHSTRLLLARTLAGQRQLEEAQRELNWLRMRLPEDQRVADLLNEVESGMTAANPSANQNMREPVPPEFPPPVNAHAAVLPVSTGLDFKASHSNTHAVPSQLTVNQQQADSTNTRRQAGPDWLPSKPRGLR